jgi:hypothetical protein
MRISTDQLKTAWQHPRRVVRNVVAAHFTGAFTTDPDVTAHAIRAAREFGWDRFLTWNYKFAELPLADDAALDWVCGEVERNDEGAPSENQKGHLTLMIAKAEIGLLERHRERLLALPGLRPRERHALERRLELVHCSPAESWRQLEDHCRRAAAGSDPPPRAAAAATSRTRREGFARRTAAGRAPRGSPGAAAGGSSRCRGRSPGRHPPGRESRR